METTLNELAKKMGEDIDRINSKSNFDVHWPCSFKFFSEICFQELSEVLIKLFEDLDSQQIKTISNKIKYPSKIAQYYYFFIGFRKTISTEKRRQISTNLLKIITLLRENPLCLDGKNKLTNFETPSFEDIEKVDTSLLNFLLQNYLELLYIFFMPLAREFHGPYRTKTGDYLIIKEFHNLDSELFKETLPKKATIYELYSSNPPKFDFFNHLLDNNGRPHSSFLKIDGSWANQEKVNVVICLVKKSLEELIQIPDKSLIKGALNSFFNSFVDISSKEDMGLLKELIKNKKIPPLILKKEHSKIRSYAELCSLLSESFAVK